VCLGSDLKGPLKAPEWCLSRPLGAVFLPVLTVLRRMWRSGIGFCHSYFLRFFFRGDPLKKTERLSFFKRS